MSEAASSATMNKSSSFLAGQGMLHGVRASDTMSSGFYGPGCSWAKTDTCFSTSGCNRRVLSGRLEICTSILSRHLVRRSAIATRGCLPAGWKSLQMTTRLVRSGSSTLAWLLRAEVSPWREILRPRGSPFEEFTYVTYLPLHAL